jgi:dienelactone hydrolase
MALDTPGQPPQCNAAPVPGRYDVEFPVAGTACRGWWYPAMAQGHGGCVVMAHGLGGLRSAGLEPYARRFAEAGFAVLLFDYRHFGASDGQPRQWVSVRRQLADWAAAVAFARRQPGAAPASRCGAARFRAGRCW